uniref:Calmodulin n=1 Tax=Mucochytrium quahogii TaxID=96639 RepID=A0A7S2RX58_9STRA|mmetsp:Transcript_19327/g.32364  ORF Transcript_19327/g.32364 Transcript_19327/m.32364 type:complete len:816 (+) Transcript_19327:184-2631(+)|eukprot:CAMPEP_0203743952 /NCGR_PEP_ID=MMETSP0098-20131031/190_1 /ASSEMBLY_ACC=CAM_ASM_000208 /TAXON_ID=96639 /ORGANISM=" , Strain NY0313808BC1" /LENGTH=815 /DNA_ID=CAMNT_0050631339 /DNA_START=171 /DNA_END=2618 /DNA_ORIENTATION=-
MGQASSRQGDIPKDVVLKFTNLELDMLKKSFKDLAQRSPGKTIDKETFLKFFPMPGLHGERLFKVFDHKMTGVIDYEEFVTGLAVCCRGSFDEKVALIFRIYDIDNNNHVSKDEMRTMLHQIPKQALYVLHTAMGEDESLNDASSTGGASECTVKIVNRLVDDAFTRFDLNQNEKLSGDQFRLWVENTPEVLAFLESVFPLEEAISPPSPANRSPQNKRSGDSHFTFTGPGTEPGYDGASNAGSADSECSPTSRKKTTGKSVLDRIKRIGSDTTIKSVEQQLSGTRLEEDGDSFGRRDSYTSEASTMTAGGEFEKTGVLYKVGRRTKTLRARAFLLRGQTLYYYHPNKLDQPAGLIFLQGCFVTSRKGEGGIRESHKALRSHYSESKIQAQKTRPADFDCTTHSMPAHAGNMFAFELITSQGGEKDSRLYFAKTEEERNSWVEVLTKASNVTQFQKKYRRLEKIGTGKFADVYKCELRRPPPLSKDLSADVIQLPEKEYFAVKVIDKARLNDKEKELLRTEIAVLKLVNHPNIISMEDVFESLNHIYIVLEFVQGGELFDRIVGRARLTETEVYPMIKQLSEAVDYLHVLGVAHRDIKPENILCTGDKDAPIATATLKICDFGLSKLITPKGVMKLACGTLSYVAPEVLACNGYDKAADLWSIGVIVYLVRRGRLPFDGERKQDIINSTLHDQLDLENDRIFADSTPEHLDILNGLLTKDPAKRLTAKQVLEHPWMKIAEKKWLEEYPQVDNTLPEGILKAPTAKDQAMESLQATVDDLHYDQPGDVGEDDLKDQINHTPSVLPSSPPDPPLTKE